MASIRTFDLDP